MVGMTGSTHPNILVLFPVFIMSSEAVHRLNITNPAQSFEGFLGFFCHYFTKYILILQCLLVFDDSKKWFMW